MLAGGRGGHALRAAPPARRASSRRTTARRSRARSTAHARYGNGTTPADGGGRRQVGVLRPATPGSACIGRSGRTWRSSPIRSSRSPAERAAFLDALFALRARLDRRPLFYQISLDWIPLLHDRGYHFFKLGEEAQVPLDRVTLEGHAGKMTRQVLRRAERDGVAFRVLRAVRGRRAAGRAARDLRRLAAGEGASSSGSSRSAIFDATTSAASAAPSSRSRGARRILAFANLLEGPRREELSVDLMRYRTDGRT